jgi:hypothetical protein
MNEIMSDMASFLLPNPTALDSNALTGRDKSAARLAATRTASVGAIQGASSKDLIITIVSASWIVCNAIIDDPGNCYGAAPFHSRSVTRYQPTGVPEG